MLPPDVLLLVCRFIPIVDLTSFLLACKTTYLLTFERSLWIDRLLQQMAEFGIMESTYDVSAMTADELRATVFRPWRFAKDLRLGNFDRLHITKIVAPADVRIVANKLLPGGRWLVSLETSPIPDVYRLRVYDMHIRGNEIHSVAENIVVYAQWASCYMDVRPQTEFGAQPGALIFLNTWIGST
ncbi:hypothetical protein FRC01_008471 [Tulasnella sp. 417]|nr:hypothetical protein FRC01_008471 [Tulasnella sp. 417]